MSERANYKRSSLARLPMRTGGAQVASSGLMPIVLVCLRVIQ